MIYWPHDTIRKVDVLTGCFWMIRREAIDEVGLLDEDFFIYGEDIDWCKRFHDAGWEIVFYPGAEAIHFHGASSSNAPLRFFIEMQKADIRYWRKHHGKIGECSYRVIILIRHLVRLIPFVFIYMICPAKRKTISCRLIQSLTCIYWVLKL